LSENSGPFAPPGPAAEAEEGRALTPKFDADGLVTCVATDAGTGEVLMVAHMNTAALARTIDAHHALPIGRAPHSDGQSRRRISTLAYGHDPGVSFYTHLSDQHGPYSIKVMSEAPYVLDRSLHHGTQLKIDTHYTDTGGASDCVFILAPCLASASAHACATCPNGSPLVSRLASTYPPPGRIAEGRASTR